MEDVVFDVIEYAEEIDQVEGSADNCEGSVLNVVAKNDQNKTRNF